jgi:hypothetical protein
MKTQDKPDMQSWFRKDGFERSRKFRSNAITKELWKMLAPEKI